LVAGITHEMNTPLGALLSATHTLERAVGKLVANDAPPAAGVLGALADSNRAIGEACKRIDGVVRRLKSFVRLDEAVEQEVAVERCIDEALALLRHRLDHIAVVRDYARTPAIACYPARLNDVFATILRNSCDALEGREPAKIVVRTRAHEKAISVEIDDNGAGMSEDELQRIFEPGFTHRESRVRLGLGLLIAYQVVHDHGGEIAFESQLGFGTKVSIDLPLGR
jgi:signal transduction histidine kinase